MALESCPTDALWEDYLNNVLPAEETLSVLDHVGNCSLCSANGRGPGATRSNKPRARSRFPLAPPRIKGDMGWLGGYRVLQALGAGGNGAVYHAVWDDRHGSNPHPVPQGAQVAIKVVHASKSYQSVFIERYHREVRLLSKIEHKSVIQIYHHGHDLETDAHYFVMTLLENGSTLKDYLDQRQGVDSTEVLSLATQLLDALRSLVKDEIHHRDIKPANIWRHDDGRIVLFDFGLARGQGDETITSKHDRLGTPNYIAPEQERGEEIDARADLYSLGVVLFEALTQYVPNKVLDARSCLDAKASPDLADFILWLLEKDREKRPQSAAEALQRLEGLGTLATSVRDGRATGNDGAGSATPATAGEAPTLPSRVNASEQPKPAVWGKLPWMQPGATRREIDLGGGVKLLTLWIPPGPFPEGSDTQLKVARIGHDFHMGATTVTQAQWQAVMGTTPWKGRGYVKKGPDFPATWVSWEDAQAFCQKVKAKTGVAARLPTEAEWEYACRAGTKTAYSFGDDEAKLGEYGWYDKNAWDIGEKYAHEVGKKKPNPWGLYDMHGNVWEWCEDKHDESKRVLRGGSWNLGPTRCRCADRSRDSPDDRDNFIGFRVVSLG